MLVTEVPVWTDCPFSSAVPDGVEIRRGRMPEWPDEMLIFWMPKAQKHVDVQMTWPESENSEPDIIDRIVAPCLNNLGMKPIR